MKPYYQDDQVPALIVDEQEYRQAVFAAMGLSAESASAPTRDDFIEGRSAAYMHCAELAMNAISAVESDIEKRRIACRSTDVEIEVVRRLRPLADLFAQLGKES